MIGRLLARLRPGDNALPHAPYECKTYRTGRRTAEACTSLTLDATFARIEAEQIGTGWTLPDLVDVTASPACDRWAGHRHISFEDKGTTR